MVYDRPPIVDAVNRQDADPEPIVGRLANVLSGPLGALALQALRVRPRQARSVESVERILSSAVAMALDRGNMDRISLEEVAFGAGVSPQAVYRYFRDVQELLRTALRCVAIREHERVVLLLADRVLPDGAEMARVVTGLVLDACDRLGRYPVHLQADMVREYRQAGFDAAPLMSELICQAPAGADVRRLLDTVKVSVALTATFAVATSSNGKVVPLRGSELEDLLADLFVGVLRGAGGAFDAFREMGVDFSACLGG